MTDVVLYEYWRSSASYRLRIAMNLAGISYQSVSVDLLKGEHKTEDYLNRNPQGLVPVLEIDGHSMTQSLAILEYLNDTRDMGFISSDPRSAAQERSIAHAIAVDIHPVCNVSVAAYAVQQSGRDETRVEWMQRFIAPGALRQLKPCLTSAHKPPLRMVMRLALSTSALCHSCIMQTVGAWMSARIKISRELPKTVPHTLHFRRRIQTLLSQANKAHA